MSKNDKPNQTQPKGVGNPTEGYFYELDVAGSGTVGFFSGCQTVGFGHEVIQDREGNGPIEKRKGRLYTKNIVIRRPYDGDMGIWDWRREIENGNFTPDVNASLIAYDETYSEIARWDITGIWPSRLITEFDENGNGYEVLTLTFDYIQRAN